MAENKHHGSRLTYWICGAIAAAIAEGLPEIHIRELLTKAGVVSLQADALQKVANGICDFESANQIHWLG